MARVASMKIWNVELGLAVHVKAPNGRYIVIDLGSTKNVSPLQTLRGKDVGYMVITHPHLDHFSDIDNIAYARPDVLWRSHSYSRDELLTDIRESDRNKITKYCDFVESYNGELSIEKDPSTGTPFGGLTADIFCTNTCDKKNKNNFSAIVVLKLGNAKIVVCGDNEKDSFERLMLRQDFKDAVKNAWILVAAHHGRESGYYEAFVELVNPYLTVISDTSNVETSVSSKYSAKSKKYSVYNSNTRLYEERHCLTTRKDGDIEIEFGETDDNNYSGYLYVQKNR